MKSTARNASKTLSAVLLSVSVAACGTMERTVQCAMPPSLGDGKPAPRVVKGPALVGEEYGLLLAPIPLDSVVFLDTSTANQVLVQAMRASRTPTDTVQLHARLFNCSRAPLEVQARVNFLLENQAPAEPVSAWRAVIIQPGSMATYTELSLGGSEVAHYLVEIGLAR